MDKNVRGDDDIEDRINQIYGSAINASDIDWDENILESE